MSKTYIHIDKHDPKWDGEYERVRTKKNGVCSECAFWGNNGDAFVDGGCRTRDSNNGELACGAGILLRRIGPSVNTEKSVNTDKPVADNGTIRKFASGATRDTATDKPDYARYLSPAVMKRYGEYMMKHQRQSDGTLRAGDNWKKGIPIEVYISSKQRHNMDVWGKIIEPEMWAHVDIEDTLCADIFNAMGMLYEILVAKTKRDQTAE